MVASCLDTHTGPCAAPYPCPARPRLPAPRPCAHAQASCHQSVHPLRAMLVPYSRALLDKVVATSLTLVTALFVVRAVPGACRLKDRA